MFVSEVTQISEGKRPEYFRDTTRAMEEVLEYFPEEECKKIQAIIFTATLQKHYVEALREVERTERGHTQREKDISRFLNEYTPHS